MVITPSTITYTTSDRDVLLPEQLDLYREGVRAYGDIAPSYHIELAKDRPQIVWDFHSLLLGVQMMLSFMITDGIAIHQDLCFLYLMMPGK